MVTTPHVMLVTCPVIPVSCSLTLYIMLYWYPDYTCWCCYPPSYPSSL